MGSAEIQKIAADFVTVFNRHDPEALGALLGSGFSYFDPVAPVPSGGSVEFVELQRAIFKVFPDIRFEVTEQVIAESAAFVAFRTTGNGKGKFGDLDVSGRNIDVEEGALLKCANGRISRMLFYSDTLKISRQLGLLS